MKNKVYFFILAGVFMFFSYSEMCLSRDVNIIWSFPFTLKVFVLSLLFGAITLLLFTTLAGMTPKLREKCAPVLSGFSHFFSDQPRAFRSPLKAGSFAFVLLTISWLPAYLAYYPGILAYDSPAQFGMIFEGYMIDHHPIAHTLTLKIFVNMGTALFHNANTGVAAYTLFQLLFLAGAFAYGIVCLRRAEISPMITFLLTIVLMIFPFNHYMAVSMTKDTMFTGFLIICVSSLCLILHMEPHPFLRSRYDWYFLAGIIGGILFRNNFKFSVMLLTGVLFILWLIRSHRSSSRKKIFFLSGTGLIVGMLLLNLLFRVTNAEQGDRREMLSLPIQQFSRCALYHGGVGVYDEDDATMDAYHMSVINDFLLDGSYRLYNPVFADPVKSHTNTYVARYRAKEFLSTYFSLLSKYPGDFLNAFLAVNAGYLSPFDRTHATIFEFENLPGKGYIQTYWFEDSLTPNGLYKKSVLPTLHRAYESWADRNAYLDIPVLKYLLVPGSYLYFYLLMIGVILMRKRYEYLLPALFLLSYMGTLMLGPVVQMRYLFPLMAVLPFMALFGCRRDPSEDQTP